MNETTTPTDRRHNAINAVLEQYRHDMATADAAGMAEAIRALAPLGRTTKWKAEVNDWAQLVIDHAGQESQAWAMIQGSVWASRSA